MTSANNNEQKTVMQAYSSLPDADKLLYKTIVEIILLLLKYNDKN